ncbi:ABC transporter permease [bacterium]|nr:ABC transporter permease [bacterium]
MSRPNPLVQLVFFRQREFVREPAILFWALIFPLLMLVVLGVAFRPKPAEPVPVLVADLHDDASVLIIKTLEASKDLRILVRSQEEATLALTRGEAALLVVPERGVVPTYRFDPTHPEARLTRLLVDEALRPTLALNVSTGDPPASASLALQAKLETTPAAGARYIDWFVPGMLAMQIMNGCLWGIGFAMVEMRAKRLLKRFAVTPMRRWHFLAAHAIHRYLVVALEAVLMVGFSAVAFGVTVRGSYLAFAVLSTLGTFAFAGIALLVAARPRNTEVAAGLMNIPMLPMIVLSGVFFSSTRFPEWLQPFIKALPLTALIDSLRRITNEGAGLEACMRELAVLLAWGLLTGALALRFFLWS